MFSKYYSHAREWGEEGTEKLFRVCIVVGKFIPKFFFCKHKYSQRFTAETNNLSNFSWKLEELPFPFVAQSLWFLFFKSISEKKRKYLCICTVHYILTSECRNGIWAVKSCKSHWWNPAMACYKIYLPTLLEFFILSTWTAFGRTT